MASLLSPDRPARGRSRSKQEHRAPSSEDEHEVFHTAPEAMNPFNDEHRGPRKLILCFDGTGNKFRGDDSDSNILKIFRCLDREAGDQYHYYQPGIGTYVVSNSLSHTSVTARVKSWYLKAKDSAIGSSFDEHVVGGYRFLMRFYNPGDDIYFFGFSRGAYVARFLAEMLDYVGLLSHGNEEMVKFAWKAFSNWQSRQSDDTPESKEKRREMYRFMKGFRETFSRPIKRIRFLGLFDTVNSVPRFETAWMQRSKFPYTARSSAKMVRHCVSIDERRAKFRQDLVYQGAGEQKKHRHMHEVIHDKYRAKRPSAAAQAQARAAEGPRGRRGNLAPPDEKAFRPHSRSRSRATNSRSPYDRSFECKSADTKSEASRIIYDDDSDEDEQDMDEVWFAGGHADVGGGWEVLEDRKAASHVPLSYMMREATKAGLNFDPEKMVEMGISPSDTQGMEDDHQGPEIRIDVTNPSPGPSTPPGVASADFGGAADEKARGVNGTAAASANGAAKKPERPETFHEMHHKAHTARIHDSLCFKQGLGASQVLSWKLMEYLPFRRMDLQSDGSWEPIRWPLPCGETRDIPSEARIHGSVIRRLQEDEAYRPGNLIVGGGGRGMRKAPGEFGIGEWECVQEPGDPIGEIWVKKSSKQSSQTGLNGV